MEGLGVSLFIMHLFQSEFFSRLQRDIFLKALSLVLFWAVQPTVHHVHEETAEGLVPLIQLHLSMAGWTGRAGLCPLVWWKSLTS